VGRRKIRGAATGATALTRIPRGGAVNEGVNTLVLAEHLGDQLGAICAGSKILDMSRRSATDGDDPATHRVRWAIAAASAAAWSSPSFGVACWMIRSPPGPIPSW
jgi:hypothetical protein